MNAATLLLEARVPAARWRRCSAGAPRGVQRAPPALPGSNAAATGSATVARQPPGTALRRDQRERHRGGQRAAPAKASLREVGGWGACLGLALPQPVFRPGGGHSPAARRALSRLARVGFARHPEGLALTCEPFEPN